MTDGCNRLVESECAGGVRGRHGVVRAVHGGIFQCFDIHAADIVVVNPRNVLVSRTERRANTQRYWNAKFS